MRVCVTGGTGFLGFQIVRQLVALGGRALGLRPPAAHPLLELGSVEKRFGDVRDSGLVREVMADCDTALHRAAVVAMSGRGAARMPEAHLKGTHNVLTAARDAAQGCSWTPRPFSS